MATATVAEIDRPRPLPLYTIQEYLLQGKATLCGREMHDAALLAMERGRRRHTLLRGMFEVSQVF